MDAMTTQQTSWLSALPWLRLHVRCVQDPNARNCHGYRKFVKRNILEDNHRGFLLNDTIVIKYTIELVVSTGAAPLHPFCAVKHH